MSAPEAQQPIAASAQRVATSQTNLADCQIAQRQIAAEIERLHIETRKVIKMHATNGARAEKAAQELASRVAYHGSLIQAF